MSTSAEVERSRHAKRHRFKRWLVLPPVLVVLVALAYLVLAPYLTLLDLEAAVRARDAAAVARHVDFPTLRTNLKARVQRFVAETAGRRQDSLMAGLATGFAANLADGVVDSFVTPEGLAKLMSGQGPDPGGSWSAHTGRFFENAGYHFESPSRFVVSVPAVAGGDIEFVLTRAGLATWRLSDIELPLPR